MSDRWKDDSDYRPFLVDEIHGPEYDNLAGQMGKTGIWLRKVVTGEINLIPDDIVLLSNITHDPKWIGWLIRRIPFLSLRATDPGAVNGDFGDDIERALDRVNSLFRERRISLLDNRLTSAEQDKMKRLTEKLRQCADAIDAELDAFANRA